MASEEEEVAEDYRVALEELSMNNRTEIVNLTSIARDYTAHALKIAEVLQQHILKAAPNKKLPALYVLDSIVKNVGTPYTLYFGRNLFKTFMESYAVANPDVRRRMEEMLRTWTQPVPGSLDTRPVFNPELVRPIENALMKFKQATMPPGQMPGRPRSAVGVLKRDTPTPPGGRGFGRPPTGQPPTGQPPVPLNGHPGPYAMHPGNPQQQPPYYGNPAAQRYQSPTPGGQLAQNTGLSNEILSKDIANLIIAMKAELAQNPNDASIHTRLKALGDLQGIMQGPSLPPDQLELIKNKVTELAAVTMRALSATPNNVPAPFARPSSAQPMVAAPVAPPPAPAPAAGQVSLDSLLGPGALAALLARGSATPQNSTPQPPPPILPQAAVRSPQPQAAQPYQQPAPAAAPSNPMTLLDQLRQAGLLGKPASATPVAPPPPPPQQPVIPASIAALLASRIGSAQGGATGVAPGMIDVNALKQPIRPDVISQLYDQLGPPCNQCGRRFKTDEDGRKKKAAHMDWHFRVHQRSNEAEQRGMHRSWYVDEKDWLKSREVVDTDQVAAAEQEIASKAAKAAEENRPAYITAPNAGSGINNVCPICQERFENKWLDEAQEWVWLDAVLVKGRAYHWSCHKEATRDREGTPGEGERMGGATVLGKRKAETGLASPKVRSLKTYG